MTGITRNKITATGRRRCRLTLLGLLVLVAAALAAPLGCSYSNPHGEQDTPPITRLRTIPAGATVTIESLGLRLETPCDLPTELDTDDEIVVRRAGYEPWEGALEDLPQIARGTYELRLERRSHGGD